MSGAVEDALVIVGSIGVAGVFLLALFDRLVPILPSAGIFMTIGVAAAEGVWCLPIAAIASVLGSSTGVVGTYQIGGAVFRREGGVRFRKALGRSDRLDGMLQTARNGTARLPFTAQLVPAARILSPVLGGADGRNRGRFLLATCAGLTVWNFTFIGMGYGFASLGSDPLAQFARSLC